MEQAIERICEQGSREQMLLLGAGASKSSGISLASEMIAEWRRDLFLSHTTDADRETLTIDDWFKANPGEPPVAAGDDREYSLLFERARPTPDDRQRYIEKKIEKGRPGWGYLYLANLMVRAGRFTTVFTTNFDDLVNEALTHYLRHNAAVCVGDAEVDEIGFMNDRVKIVKLHGDYLFRDQKNTVAELQRVGERMASKFAELSRARGLVVIGYAGRDESIMHMIELLFADASAFNNHVYWGLRPGEEPSRRVTALCQDPRHRLRLFTCDDFDEFMASLHARLELTLPESIVSPHSQLDAQLRTLVESARQCRDGSSIRAHAEQLREQLGRPIEAELALSKRDFVGALRLADAHIAKYGPTVGSLTVRGQALAMQAEGTGRTDLVNQAVAAFTQAIDLDPAALRPRYSLATTYFMSKRFPEAIATCEALSPLAKDDRGMHVQLVQLYLQAQRLADAERVLDQLMASFQPAADLHFARALIRNAQGRYVDAAKELKRAIGLDGTNAAMHFALGQQYVQLQRFDDAENATRAGLEIDPSNVMGTMQMGNLLIRRRDWAAAQPLLDRVATQNPDSAEVQGWLGTYYMQSNRMDDAETAFRRAAALTPDDGRVWHSIGEVLIRRNRFQDAQQAYEKSRALNPSAPAPIWWLGVLAMMRQDARALEECAATLTRLDPMAAQNLRMQGANIARQLSFAPDQYWAQERALIQGTHAPAAHGSAGPGGQGQGLLSWLLGS